MKLNFYGNFIIAFIFHALFLPHLVCLAQNSTGVVSHIVEHIDTRHIKRIDSKQHDVLYDEKIRPWSLHEIVTDTSIRVYFQINSSCIGHRAVLQEADDAIDIVVISGHLHVNEDGEGYECRPIGMLGPGTGSFLLHTKKPIGNRKITQNNSPPVELRER